jgi:hypothetical protein
VRSNRTRLAAGVVALGSLLTAPAGAQDQAAAPARFVTFAVPGVAGYGSVSGIDPGSSVDVVGIWEDKRHVVHGYLRTPDGAFTVITPPGAVELVSNPSLTLISISVVINAVGSIAGFYRNALSQVRGFVRSRRGNFTLFDVPESQNVTIPPPITAISPTGAMAGYHRQGSYVVGFLRNPDGSLVSFGANFASSTIPMSINAAGTIVGIYEGHTLI